MTGFEEPFPTGRGYAAVAAAWIIAQLIKVLRYTVRHKRFNFRWIIDTGGMPSSHSSGTASLATVVGLYAGFDSILFLFALAFAVVTMFDAASVRRSVGRQAILMNKIIDEMSAGGAFPEQRVREFLGHTPVEVLAGGSLGVSISILFCA